MDVNTFEKMRSLGENICIEFKRGGNGFEEDSYQTICSFLNRFGGDIFLGVLNDGTVIGFPEEALQSTIRNFISRISNPDVFSPTIYLVPDVIEYEGKHIIHVHIPPSVEVHRFKKDIYDRVDDADVKVTSTGAIAQMYIRKQNIYTEKKIYPYVSINDLRLDLLPKLRVMAVNNSDNQNHPWTSMTDEELLKSASLYGMDRSTGETGYNLAAVMLLGKDEVIKEIEPAYVTDALLRRVNTDRYDDREIIQTNLIESYERLLAFARKHLLDKFFLEGEQRKSLRSILTREMISNVLIHREFTSPFQAKFVIEKDRMYVENANRVMNEMVLTPDNLEPNPKNPIIASFFRNIGYADHLGSGVRNLFKYSKFYSGKDPVLEEKDVFRIVVPLDDAYSYDMQSLDESADKVPIKSEEVLISTGKVSIKSGEVPISADKAPIKSGEVPISADKVPIKSGNVPKYAEKSQTKIEEMPEAYGEGQMDVGRKLQNIDQMSKVFCITDQERRLLEYAQRIGYITTAQAEELLHVKARRARDILRRMVTYGVLVKKGKNRGTIYVIESVEREL